MANPSKQKGTAWESAIVRYLQANGYSDAERLALRGSKDIGDVRWTKRVHLEAKGGNMAHAASWQQCEAWLREAEQEGFNANTECYLLVKRKGHAVAGNGRFFCRLSALTGNPTHLTMIEMTFTDAVELAHLGYLIGFDHTEEEEA